MVNILVDELKDVVGWLLVEVGLAGTVSVGLVVTAGMYLWWGYRLHHVIEITRMLVVTATKHVAVSLIVSALLLGALIHAGIITGVSVDAAVDVASGIVDALAEVIG